MKYCPQCGTECQDEAVFCTNCGNRFDEQVQQPIETPPEPLQYQQSEYQQPQEFGQPQTYQQPQAYQQPMQPPYQGYPPPVIPQKKKNVGLIIGISVAAGLLLIGAVAAVVSFLIFNTTEGNDVAIPTVTPIFEVESTPTPQPTPTEIPADPLGRVSRTFMIYMVGSDLETNLGAATMDIAQIIYAEPDLEWNNIVIMTGGALEWQNDVVSPDRTQIYEIVEEDIELVWDNPRLNMADPYTLTTFLDFCADNYITDEYCLIMWNHGAGPNFGFGYDEYYDDILTIPALVDSLAASTFGTDKKLEFIGFDACLMGSIEIAYALSDYTSYMISSQDVIPAWGWDYDFFGEIEPDMTTEEIAITIIDMYYDFCNYVFDEIPDFTFDITLSCLNLDNIDEFEIELNNLYAKAGDLLNAQTFSSAANVRNGVKEFGYVNMYFSYDLVDIGHLARLMADDYPTESAALTKALDNLVTYNKSNVPNAGGVSLYFPYNNKELLNELAVFYSGFNFADDYTNFMHKFIDLLQDVPEIDWNISKVQSVRESDTTYSIQLTPEQVETYASAHYYIIMDYKDDSPTGNFAGYYFVFNSSDVTLEDDGRLVAHYEGKTQMMYDPEEDTTFDVTMLQSELTETYARYLVPVILRDWTSDDWSEWKSMNAWIHIQMDLDGSNARVISVLPSIDSVDNDNAFIPSREWVDIYEYSMMECWSWAREVKYNDDGSLAPFSEWESGGKGVGWEVKIDPVARNNLTFVQQERDDEHDYYMLINVKDVYGNVVSSEMIPIK